MRNLLVAIMFMLPVACGALVPHEPAILIEEPSRIGRFACNTMQKLDTLLNAAARGDRAAALAAFNNGCGVVLDAVLEKMRVIECRWDGVCIVDTGAGFTLFVYPLIQVDLDGGDSNGGFEIRR